jgi:hypothetical protein
MGPNTDTREVEILVNAQRANASIKEMGAGVALLTNQLNKMAADDPRRAALKRDFDVLSERVGAARKEMRTYAQTEEEVRLATERMNQENREVILNGQKLNSSFKDMKAASAQLEKQLESMNGDDAGRKKMLADYHALQDRIEGVGKEMKRATEGTSSLKQGFANAFALFAGGGLIGLAQQLFGFFAASREEFLGSAKSSADLEATLVATRHAAGLTADEIRKIGEERSKVTLFDDDETNRASAMLLTFKNVKKGVFEEAIPAIQDLATKMAGDGPADMKGASIQLGKALNDPITGVTKLTKVGVTFTEQQKEQIAAMVKAGDVAGAQRVILGELNSEFGGSAEAARKAGGGVATLTMRWNEFKETVGGKVSGVLDDLSQWLGRVLDKAAPLLDMVSELGDEFAAYYHDISDLVEGLGLFNEKTDTAQLVVDGLKYALTVLLLPLKGMLEISKAIVNGFIDWYNKSEMLRGVLGGLAAVIGSVFTTIKDDALKILGGVGDIIIGIFTLDKNKIIAGFKSAMAATADVMLEGGNKAADAFAKGYEANKNNHITRTVRVKTEETTSSEGGTAAQGEETPAGESEKARKAREAAEKKAKAARDKVDRERLSDLKRWVEQEGDLLDQRDVLAGQREQVAFTVQGKQRQDQQDKVVEAAKKQFEKLTGLEADYTQQVAAIVTERDEQLRALQEKFAEQDEKQHTADIDKKIKDNEADTQVLLAELQNELANKFMTQQSYEEFVYQTKQASMERELALIKQKSGQESAEYKKLLAEKLRDQAAHTTKTKALDNDATKFKKGLGAVEKVLNDENVKWLEESLGEQTILYKAFKAARKADAIANIGVNLYEEIQSYWAESSTFGPAGIAWATIQSTLAFARAGMATAKVAGYYQGGATGASAVQVPRPADGMPATMMGLFGMATGISVGTGGQLLDEQGREVAGIVHKNEYVIPEWMRQDPQVLQVENWLEARRQRGSFFDGGTTTAGDARARAATGQDGAEQSQLVQVLTSLDQRLRDVEQWPTQLNVALDLLDLAKKQDKIKQVQSRSEIRPK